MIRWWDTLAQRERWVLAGGAMAAACALMWVLLIEPAAARRESLEQAVRVEQVRLEQLRDILASLPEPETGPGASPGLPDGQSLFAVVNGTAGSHDVAGFITRVSPRGASEVDLTVESVPFDDLADWLADIARAHGIAVTQAALTRNVAPGFVTGTLSLEAQR